MLQNSYLSFQLPSGEYKEIALNMNEVITLGRNRSSTIKLNLPSVSRQHARFYYETGSFWVEDLKSSNGTFVNKDPVLKPTRIHNGDLIQCGEFYISIVGHRKDNYDAHSIEDNSVSSEPSEDYEFATEKFSVHQEPIHSQRNTADKKGRELSPQESIEYPSSSFTMQPDQSRANTRQISSKLLDQEPEQKNGQANEIVLKKQIVYLLEKEKEQQKEISKYQKSIADLEERKMSHVALSDQLKRELDQKEKHIANQNEKIDELRATLENNALKYENLKTDHQYLSVQLENQNSQKDNQIKQSRQEITRLEVEVSQLKKDQQRSLDLAVDKELSLLRIQQQELDEQIAQLRSENRALNTRELELEDLLNHKDSEIHRFKSRILSLESEIQVLKESSETHTMIKPKVTHFPMMDWTRQQARLENYLSEVISLREINHQLKKQLSAVSTEKQVKEIQQETHVSQTQVIDDNQSSQVDKVSNTDDSKPKQWRGII